MKITKVKRKYSSCDFCRRKVDYNSVYQLEADSLPRLLLSVCPICVMQIVDFIDDEECKNEHT